MAEEKLKIAVFVDYDNIEIGVKSTLRREFDVSAVLEGLKERGEVVTKIAYANWGKQSGATRSLTEYGVQMVQRDPSPRGDKNGADINLALDALEMAFTKDHINTFAIVSGDSDFMALVEKLKQYNKRVLVVGGKAFTSTILQRNCHEFISYESLIDSSPARAQRASPSHRQAVTRRGASLPLGQALPLIDRALNSLDRREVTPQLGLLKSTMQQIDPVFTERDYGTSSFSDFVHKLAEAGYVRLHRREGNFIVERVEAGKESAPAPTHNREHAAASLRTVLEANLGFVSVGIPAKELSALFHAANPGFDHKEYGFTEFEELLNLAQDKGLVRIDADPEQGLRVFPGPELVSHAGSMQVAPAEVSEEAASAHLETVTPAEPPTETAPPRRAPRRRAAAPRGSRSRPSRPRRSTKKAEQPQPEPVEN